MIKPYLPPFKRWTLQNFPFIEDDFDSITNYQLYCKIVEYIKSVDTYMQGVDSFLTEVENYFNNLDVQEEINNKLDEMAEDGTLEEIINQEIFSQINTDIENLKNNVSNLQNEDSRINNTKPNLQYCFTHHEEDSVFQGMCCDSNYYYYANAGTGIYTKIYKRSLASNELIDTLTGLNFGHCNDLTILNNILYSANYSDYNGDLTRRIGTYNLTTNTESYIEPFETQEIVNAGYNFVWGITKYDNTHLLCMLGKSGYTNLSNSNIGLFLLNITDNTYEQITLTNSNNLKLDNIGAFQSIEYSNNKLYILVSETTAIYELFYTEDSFDFNRIYTYETYDILGQNIGEVEGISIVPDTYNGKNTLMLMSQVLRFNRNKMTLKFYCFNPITNLTVTKIPSGTLITYPSLLSEIFCDADSTSYFEDGSSSHPFKDLLSAIECCNFSQFRKGEKIKLYGGNYDIYDINMMSFVISGQESGINLNGHLKIINSKGKCYIGNVTFNNDSFNVANSDVEFNSCTFNDTSTSTLIIQANSNVTFKSCSATLGSYFDISDSIVKANFTSISRTSGSSQMIATQANTILFIGSPSTLPTSKLNRNSNSSIIYGGYVNAPQ